MCELKIQEKSFLQSFSLSFLTVQVLGPFSLLSFSPYKRDANITFLSSRLWLILLLTPINAHQYLLHIHRKSSVFLCLCSLLSHWAMTITLRPRKASKIISQTWCWSSIWSPSLIEWEDFTHHLFSDMFTVPTGINIWKAENLAKIFQNSSYKTTSFHVIDWGEMLYTVNIMFVDPAYSLISVQRKTDENIIE